MRHDKKKKAGGPRPMPAWFAPALKIASMQDHINALPFWRRWFINILAFFNINYLPDWAIPPGYVRSPRPN